MARISLRDLRNKVMQAIEEHRYDDAAASCRAILAVYPKGIQAFRMLGEALWENGMPEQASEAFQKVLELDPEDFVAYAGLGLIAEQQGSLDKAITYVQKASELAPNSEEVRSELVRLYERKGIADSARLKISRSALARIYAHSEMPSRAIPEFQAVLADQPDRVDLRLALAEALWREGQLPEARQEAETVLQYLPDSIKGNLILAIIAQNEGREQNAQALLASVQDIDPLGEYAERLFGSESPLPPADPLIDIPDYLLGSTASKASTADIEIELPDWLKEDAALAESTAETDKATGTAPVAAATEAVSSPPLRLAGETAPIAEQEEIVAAAVSSVTEAWQLYQNGDLPAALSAYRALIQQGTDLDSIIQGLTVIYSDKNDIDALELLGDAHARAGHYRAALDIYQKALDRLQS